MTKVVYKTLNKLPTKPGEQLVIIERIMVEEEREKGDDHDDGCLAVNIYLTPALAMISEARRIANRGDMEMTIQISFPEQHQHQISKSVVRNAL